jgi:hypothetical protein
MLCFCDLCSVLFLPRSSDHPLITQLLQRMCNPEAALSSHL